MRKNKKIGFIGAGNMAEALIRGLLESKVAAPGLIFASDASVARLKHVCSKYKVKAMKGNRELAGACDIIFLAVKPQIAKEVLEEAGQELNSSKLVISIMAGVCVKDISARCGKGVRVIRVMPNTPALVLKGAAAFYAGDGTTEADRALCRDLLGAVGEVIEVKDEGLMDAVTGLSGSGPAFMFVILEALSDAGVRMGLARASANRLAVQTMLGSAMLAQAWGKHFGELKDMVASPGGTTIAGLKKLEEGRIRATLMEAVEAATMRSIELSGKGR
jgi:pyrroline-5-carboxylate reductase